MRTGEMHSGADKRPCCGGRGYVWVLVDTYRSFLLPSFSLEETNEGERETFLRKYPGVRLCPGVQPGAYCLSSPQGLTAITVHL